MNFLNRKMFQAGGSANQYFYVDSLGNKQFLDENKLRSDLRATQTDVLSALIQNPDVTYSPATQELFRQVVAERQAPISSLDPSMFEFGEFLPDFISPKAGVKQTGSFVTDVGKTFAETGINLGRYLGQAFSERKPGQAAFQPVDIFPSERFPFDPSTLSGQRRFQDENIDRSGVLREGFTNEELDRVLGRSVLDFSEDIAELEKEPVVTEETEEDVIEQAPSIPTPMTGGETLGRSSDLDIARRQIEFEKSMIGRDEFGDPLPEGRPDFVSQLPSPDRTEPVDLPPAVENEIQNALDELEGVTVPELVPETKPSVTFEKPKIDLQNVDTEITIDDFNRERAPKLPPKETSGVFGSDRFLDFIRNVGGELARTGQLGEGLASGAAKAAEERAARDLLQEEEARKQKQAKELLSYEASLEAVDAGIMDYKEAKSLGEAEESIDTAIRNFSGSERTLKDLDAVFKDLEDPNAYGLKGWLTQSMTKLAAAAGMSLGDWKNLDPTTRINTTLDVLAQQSVREILGESGKTISNLDRQIVADIFGNLTIFTQPADIKKRLTRTRNNVLDSMEQDRRAIIRGTSYLARTGQTSPQVTAEEQLINKILGIDFNTLREPGSYFASEGIIDTTLRPTT